MVYEKRGRSILVLKWLFKRVIYLSNRNFDSFGYRPILERIRLIQDCKVFSEYLSQNFFFDHLIMMNHNPVDILAYLGSHKGSSWPHHPHTRWSSFGPLTQPLMSVLAIEMQIFPGQNSWLQYFLNRFFKTYDQNFDNFVPVEKRIKLFEKECLDTFVHTWP